MRKLGLATLLLLLGLGAPARADLPKGFDWSDEHIWSLARNDPAAFGDASPAERQRIIQTLVMCPNQSAGFPAEVQPGQLNTRVHAAIGVLGQASDEDRFKTLQLLDRSGDVNVKELYTSLDRDGQRELVTMVKAAGDAGTAAGLQQTGAIADNDDTSFPTQYHPNGYIGFKDAGKAFKAVVLGSDGKGNPGNMHYVSARSPLTPPSLRLAAAGMPKGTKDYRTNLGDELTGLDGIQDSKVNNIKRWLMLHPGQRFVFWGDTIQRDPEVYRNFIRTNPDQVQLVMIHKAGGKNIDPETGKTRDPANYQGEIFFDDYDQALAILKQYGVIQPGAKLGEKVDLSTLPAPDTDVSKIHADGFPKVILDYPLEEGGALGKVVFVGPVKKFFGWIAHHGHPDSAKTPGAVGALDKVDDSTSATGEIRGEVIDPSKK